MSAPAKENNEPLSRALRRGRSILLSVGLFSMVINGLMLVGPLYMLQIYDRVLASSSVPTLLYLTLAAVGLILTASLLEFVRARVLVRLSGQLDEELGGTIFAGLVSHVLQRPGTGGQAQPLRDLDSLRVFLTGPGLISLFDAPWAPLFLAVIFIMHPVLGLVALAGAILLFAAALANELMTRDPLRRASSHEIGAMRFAESALRNAEVIEAMGMLPGLRRRWLNRHRNGLALQSRASDRAGFIAALTKFVRPSLQIAMLGTGAYLAIHQIITPGVMIAASIIMGRALAPVEGAIHHWRNVVMARTAHRRLKDFLGDVVKRNSTLPLPRPEGRLAVEKLVAAPPGAKVPVLKGISFRIEPGESLGIIGPSAAGKSTLARLMVGVWRPASGSVRLDGADVADWDHLRLGPHVGYLPQDVELFDGTVAHNIARFTKPEPEEVIAAARKAGVHDMILRLPDGYSTLIGEGGAILSGGQRQRLGLARALYRDPAFIVLDEPNANLDGEGEGALREALSELKERGTTVVVIAHRPSILASVDKLLLLRDGLIEMFGPREELAPKVTRPVREPANAVDAPGPLAAVVSSGAEA
ncbi:MAG: type I secretion system permease/ATPase [Alphaproteobacteria bacterium]|nr:type I secretion system permease/ATPase [Alphaproteobacteria bacterium]